MLYAPRYCGGIDTSQRSTKLQAPFLQDPEQGVIRNVVRRLSAKATAPTCTGPKTPATTRLPSAATTRLPSAATAHRATDRAAVQVWIVRDCLSQRLRHLVWAISVSPVMATFTADRRS